MSAVLCLDVGNTRLKWQVAAAGHVIAQGATASASPVIDITKPVLKLVTQVVVSSVLGESTMKVLEPALKMVPVTKLSFVGSRRAWGALTNGYDDPARLGVDRWLAMIAAVAEHPTPVVVVDAGTALTVDGVTSTGQHLGGYIVPGLRTMLRSLGESTAAIPTEALSAAAPGARSASTRDAVCNGVVEASRGLVDRAVTYLRNRENLEPTVVVTGGDRRLVAYERSGWCLCPDLVLRGIRHVAGDLNRFAPP